jgi:hypothetical protein
MDKNPKHSFESTIIDREIMLLGAFDENDLDAKSFFHDPELCDSKPILTNADFYGADRLESVSS